MSEPVNTKPIKEFTELFGLNLDQALLCIGNMDAGSGAKILFGAFLQALLSQDADNDLVLGDDGRIYYKSTAIDHVDWGDIGGDISNQSDLEQVFVKNEDFATIYPVISKFDDGASGYRIWSDGYCEQVGIQSVSGTNTITLLKKFKNTNYHIFTSQRNTQGSGSAGNIQTEPVTANTFKIYFGSGEAPASWKACGYLAEGEW